MWAFFFLSENLVVVFFKTFGGMCLLLPEEHLKIKNDNNWLKKVLETRGF